MCSIKIITNHFHEDLGSMSRSFYQDLDFEYINIDGTTGIYGLSFFQKVIENITCDWMIYIDEDCFITDIHAMIELLHYQIENNICFSGMPDGGIIRHRFHNPISINPFFTIIDVKKMKQSYYQIEEKVYSQDLNIHIPHHIIKNGGILFDNFEPYYEIFFTMLRNHGTPLYLDAYDSPLDELTTVLKNHKGVDFAFHTWFARSWHEETNKNRILNVFKMCSQLK